MARAHHPLVQRAHGPFTRRGHDGVLENRTRSRNVWCELLRDQEQKGHRVVAGRRCAWPQHLRKGRQVRATNRITHIIQYQFN